MPLAWQILYWSWVLSEIIIAIATRTRSGGGKVDDRGTFALLWVVILSSLISGVWLRAAGVGGPS